MDSILWPRNSLIKSDSCCLISPTDSAEFGELTDWQITHASELWPFVWPSGESVTHLKVVADVSPLRAIGCSHKQLLQPWSDDWRLVTSEHPSSQLATCHHAGICPKMSSPQIKCVKKCLKNISTDVTGKKVTEQSMSYYANGHGSVRQ